jgi:hypothetical protein
MAIPQTPAEFGDSMMGFLDKELSCTQCGAPLTMDENLFSDMCEGCLSKRNLIPTSAPEVFGEAFGPGYAGYIDDRYEFDGEPDIESVYIVLAKECIEIVDSKTHHVLDRTNKTLRGALRTSQDMVNRFGVKRVSLFVDRTLRESAKDLVMAMCRDYVDSGKRWLFVNIKVAN